MYAYMKGKVTEYFEQGLILEVNNIGYNIYMSNNEIDEIDKSKETKIYTYYEHKEDYTRIFGFSSVNRLNFFKKLISVNGVGTKMAMSILGAIEVEKLATAIATDDINIVKSAPGVGPKLAAKIILELKDKIDNSEIINTKKIVKSKNHDEAIVALKVLGYTDKEIEMYTDEISVEGKSVQEIIKQYLKCFQLNR